jgi:hypothetical protein
VRWHQEVLVHNAGSGHQKLGLAVCVLSDDDMSTLSKYALAAALRLLLPI